METEGQYTCKKCSKSFEQSSYSSIVICDECIESVAPWKLRTTGVGCFVLSVLALLAGVGIIVGVFEAILAEGLMTVVSKYRLSWIVVLALLVGGVVGILWSTYMIRDAGTKKE